MKIEQIADLQQGDVITAVFTDGRIRRGDIMKNTGNRIECEDGDGGSFGFSQAAIGRVVDVYFYA